MVGEPAGVSFTDLPLTDLIVLGHGTTTHSLAGAGAGSPSGTRPVKTASTRKQWVPALTPSMTSEVEADDRVSSIWPSWRTRYSWKPGWTPALDQVTVTAPDGGAGGPEGDVGGVLLAH